MSNHEIFLSYSHENKEIVDKLFVILTNTYKLSVWRDINEIRDGKRFDEEIFNGIINSKLVICCFSKHYLESDACIQEFRIASHKKKTCLAFMLEKVDLDNNPKSGFYSIGMQRCNIYKNKHENPPIDFLEGDRFTKFITNIKTFLGKDTKKDECIYDAYLSYDLEFAHRSNRLVENLRKHDFNIYREYLRIGNTDKDFEITKNAIDSSTLFICCQTKSYSKNEICLREIDYADAIRKPKLVLMFENYTKEELKHLGDLLVDACIVKMFDDKKKEYEEGIGEKFNEVVSVLRSMLQENKGGAVISKPKEKIYDLWITCAFENRALIEEFAKRLSKEKCIDVSYSSSHDKNSTPNYDAVKRAETLLAIVTSTFEKTFECFEETSYANRNSIPITYVIDKNVKIEKNSQLHQMIEDTPSENAHKDLALLEAPIEKNIVAASVEHNLQVVQETNDDNTAPKVNAVDNEVNEKFEKAVSKGDLDSVKRLHKKGADMNKRNNDGQIPIYITAQKGHLDVVKYLLAHNVNVNSQNKDGQTALFVAARKDHFDILKYLIENGADVNLKDNHGDTALFKAAWGNSLDCIKFLLENGANIHEKNTSGRTALFAASRKGEMSVYKYLIDQNAKKDEKDSYGYTAAEIASIHKS